MNGAAAGRGLMATTLALFVSARRIGFNQLNGRAMTPAQWHAATALTLIGRTAVLAVPILAGLGVRWMGFTPEPGSPAFEATMWAAVVLITVAILIGTTPNDATQLRHPSDRTILMAITPLRSSQLWLARAALPQLLSVCLIGIAATGFALAAWGTTRAAALCIAIAVGSAMIAAVIALGILSLLMIARKDSAWLRSLIIAGIAGMAAGIIATVMLAAAGMTVSGSSPPEFVAALQASALRFLLDAQPAWWHAVMVWHPLLVGLAAGTAAALLTVSALPLHRRAVRTGMLQPTDHAARSGSATTVRRPVFGRQPAALMLLRKDLHALFRLPAAAAAPARRLALGSTAVFGLALGALLAGGRAAVTFPEWSGMGFMLLCCTVVAATSDAIVAVAGIEAERRAWQFLRATPIPRGRLFAVKSLSCAAITLLLLGPPFLATALLCTGGAVQTLALAGTLLVLALAAGIGAALGSAFARNADGSEEDAVVRDPLAALLQAAVIIVTALPVLIAEGIAGSGAALATAAGCTLLLLATLTFTATTDRLYR